VKQSNPSALKRRIPKVKELASLMRFDRVDFSATARLRRANTISDLRTIAKRRTPRAPFDSRTGLRRLKSPSGAPARPSLTWSSARAFCATSKWST